jgi:hypothetical protein
MAKAPKQTPKPGNKGNIKKNAERIKQNAIVLNRLKSLL